MNGESEEYLDVVGETVGDEGNISMKTDYLRTEIMDGHPIGVRTLRWSGKVCLVTGTDDGDNHVTVSQTLSPDKAREVAETLLQAADDSERMPESDVDQEEEKSFLRSLIG